MKTNFKKLAMVAGVTAALAGGSMSAHAVIQAVPAPAALIPLFTTGDAAQTALLRVQVPASVGKDDVISVLNGGPLTQPDNQATFNPNLSASIKYEKSLSAIHWFHMDEESNELNDGVFPVSANDVVEMTSDAMITAAGSLALQSKPGYLVLVNESATSDQGFGNPQFAFTAEAFIVDGQDIYGGINVAFNIPTFPLSDSADGDATAPTLSNNVVENFPDTQPAGSPYGSGPIVSPLISGIRTASSEGGVRVVDLPIHFDTENYVIWNDRNAVYNVPGLKDPVPGLNGSYLLYNTNESNISAGSLSLEHQLNMLDIGNGGEGTNPLWNWEIPHKHIDASKAAQGGFLRWVISKGINYGNVKGAYAAAVIFRLPNMSALPEPAPAAVSSVGAMNPQPVNDGYSAFPLDRGFFKN